MLVREFRSRHVIQFGLVRRYAPLLADSSNAAVNGCPLCRGAVIFGSFDYRVFIGAHRSQSHALKREKI